MGNNSGEEAKPYLCGTCKAPLPITISFDDDAVALVCATCGERYLGKIWKVVPPELAGYVRVASL